MTQDCFLICKIVITTSFGASGGEDKWVNTFKVHYYFLAQINCSLSVSPHHHDHKSITFLFRWLYVKMNNECNAWHNRSPTNYCLLLPLNDNESGSGEVPFLLSFSPDISKSNVSSCSDPWKISFNWEGSLRFRVDLIKLFPFYFIYLEATFYLGGLPRWYSQ